MPYNPFMPREKEEDAEESYMELMKVPPEIRDRARLLRANMSRFEKRVWKLLGGEGNQWGLLRQVPHGGYFLDFFSPEQMACVEADGPDHLDTAAKDATRDVVLRKAGIRTLRVTPADFARCRPMELLSRIASFIESDDSD